MEKEMGKKKGNSSEEASIEEVRGLSKEERLGDQIISTLKNVEEDYQQFRDHFYSLRKNFQSFMEEAEEKIEEIEEKAEEKVEKEKVDRVEKEVEEVDEDLQDVMEEVGFGESLDVSKIPPKILTQVYQDTLNEAVDAMRNNLGEHDANRYIEETLDQMRTRTSGSELFQFNGRIIKIRNLISSVENNLISAKQIHTTYVELLDKLSERIPGYEPENFRSMIKSKSLEFAIDKSTKVIKKTERIDSDLEELSEDYQGFSNRIEGKIDEIDERLDDFEDLIEEKVDELEKIQEKMEEVEDFLEDKERLEEKINELEASFEMKFSTFENELEGVKEKMEGEGPPGLEGELSEEEKFVYYAIPDDGGTVNKIEKAVGKVIEDVEEKLESLKEKGAVDRFKRGRWTIYERTSDELVSEEEEEEEGEEEKEEEEGEEGEEESEEEIEGVESWTEEIGKTSKEMEEEEEVEEIGEEEPEITGEEEIETEEEIGKEVEEGTEEEKVEEEEKEEVKEEEGEEEIEEEGEEEVEGENFEQIILNNIPDDGCTIHHLNREIERIDKSELEDILDELIDEEKVSTTQRNRWTIYLKQNEVG